MSRYVEHSMFRFSNDRMRFKQKVRNRKCEYQNAKALKVWVTGYRLMVLMSPPPPAFTRCPEVLLATSDGTSDILVVGKNHRSYMCHIHIVIFSFYFQASCMNRGSVSGYFLAGRSMHFIPVSCMAPIVVRSISIPVIRACHPGGHYCMGLLSWWPIFKSTEDRAPVEFPNLSQFCARTCPSTKED